MCRTFSYVWLLLLLICCWHCMGRPKRHRTRVPDHSSDSSESSSDSSESSSYSSEHSSHSSEHSSSCEKHATCTDCRKNQDESDVDCGGDKCPKCADNKICLVDCDCISHFCKDNRCAERSTVLTTDAPATAETTTTSLLCDFECKNGGTCISRNQCICTTGFSGPTCEVQSVGLCSDNETMNTTPILLITFGNGSEQYSQATPGDFNFTTTYKQGFKSAINDGMFGLMNSIYKHPGDAWHAGATDHTEDENGYMYMVNADFTPGEFYKGRVDNLCIGLRYEFSVYLANICREKYRCIINPNVLFEVRSAVGNELLAQLESGDVPEHPNLIWTKYGMSFVASESSVNLLMISNARGGNGNDLVIDDIALRVCAHTGTGFCRSN